MLQNWNATDQMGTVTTKKEKNMKKFAIISAVLFLGLSASATELNSIFYGIRSGIDTLSDVNRLRGQVIQTNAQKQELENKQETLQNSQPQNANYSNSETPKTNSSFVPSSAEDEGTAFTAKSNYAMGNIYLKQGKYREAIDSYYNAKMLFEAIGDTENAQKSEQVIEYAQEMRCEFGDYCQ